MSCVFTMTLFYLVPNIVTGLHCKYSSGGYGLTLVWDPPNGGRTQVQVNMSSTSFRNTGKRQYIGGLLPAQWYTFTVSAFSGPVQSIPVSITCQTDPRGKKDLTSDCLTQKDRWQIKGKAVWDLHYNHYKNGNIFWNNAVKYIF